MCNKIHCPTCGSTKVFAIDNQALSNDNGLFENDWLKKNDKQFDDEIYFEFKCECGNTFSEALDIVVREKKPKQIKLVIEVFVDGNFSELDSKNLIENAEDALTFSDNFKSKVITFIVSEQK